MKSLRISAVIWAAALAASPAPAVNIETVLVGNAGNAADTQIMSDGTTGYGAVPYEYRIGKYEVTNAQYAEFLNAVDLMGTNERWLYNSGMTLGPTPQFGGIDFHASAANGSKYAAQAGREKLPVIYVTWYTAIRFANWLHNGQGSGDTETGAYTLGPLYVRGAEPLNGKDIARNPGARWFLPSEDEWYKAAYHKNDGVTGNYWDYPTRSDIAPSDDLPPGGANSANIRGVLEPVFAVGSYPLSYGPYGTFDQAGNGAEWNEALLSHGSHFTQVMRGMRGGGAASQRGAADCEGGGNAGCGSIYWTFRVASVANPVPEPGSWLLLAAGAAIIALGVWRFRFSTVICVAVLVPSAAQAVVIETVLVGNAGNAADTQIMSDGTSGYGAVPYEYRIGKYEVTNAQYAEFLNAKDPTGIDTLGLYLPDFCDRIQCGINFNAAAADGAKYVVKPARGNHPVTYVTWYQAIRFANWLHNGQGNGDTETGAYTLGPLAFGSPLHGNNITRNVGARWFLPSENEWYKAAYHKNDGVTGNYWDYPTRSNSAPTRSIPPGGVNSANFNDVLGDVSPVGAYSLTPGPYGTFDQTGNVGEWNEALLTLGQFDSDGIRGTRGGSWFGGNTDVTESLAASSRPAGGCAHGGNMSCGGFALGFRVASVISVVPEPSTSLLILSGVAVALLTHRRVRVVVAG